MVMEPYKLLVDQLKQAIPPSAFITDKPRRLVMGTDAGFYRLIPELVVMVDSETQIRAVLAACTRLNIGMTFRGSGTSLSGQAISDSVLVMPRDGWKRYTVHGQGEKITLGIAMTGGRANDILKPYNRKLGPDPASIRAASIAGIIANNASGMTCGTEFNSWNTIDGIRVILADGTILDTRDTKSRDEFRQARKAFLDELVSIARAAKKDPELKARILKKFEIKNTTGYAINSLVAFDDPIDMVEHLMVGSEGTLGIITEATLKTVDRPPQSATSLMAFEDSAIACEAIITLKQCGAAAAEFMDRKTICAVENLPGVPSFLKTLPSRAVTVLAEVREHTREDLTRRVEKICKALEDTPQLVPARFSFDEEECKRLWEIREGFDPIIAAKSPPGTIMVCEDIAVPLESIGGAVRDLREISDRHGYTELVIFGHALAGNIHFDLLVDFNSDREIERFKIFIDDMVRMVVEKYDGSLKAEHGTGRNMAPFVEKEWGGKAFALMEKIKALFDPEGILNPGVIFNKDPRAHVSNLKRFPLIHPGIDKCVECGFCEQTCVSHGLTLSARQRVVFLRHLALLHETGKDPEFERILNRDLKYLVMETCATCSLCETACPSGINLGKYVKKMRAEHRGPFAKWMGEKAADHMDVVTSMARKGLSAGRAATRLMGEETVKRVTGQLAGLPAKSAARFGSHLPLPAENRVSDADFPEKAVGEIVYFPSCINRMMGRDAGGTNREDLIPLVLGLCKRAGLQVKSPENRESLCCGLAFASKGYEKAAQKSEKKLAAALLKATDNGRLPVLCDASSCLHHMRQTLPSQLKLYEPAEFTTLFLASRLQFRKLEETIMLHVNCSTKNMGLEQELIELAKKCASRVVLTNANCCGFAGDRGFFRPELKHHGLRCVAGLDKKEITRGFATNRTCEIGLSDESGIPFQSILYLVEECTRNHKSEKTGDEKWRTH